MEHESIAHGGRLLTQAGIRLGEKKRLRFALWLTAGILVLEIIGGIYSHSLALLSDAGHVLTDLSALVVSYLALTWSEKPPTAEKTYGYYRFEILSALLNGIALAAVTLYILYEAAQRLVSPQLIKAPEMLAVASVGLMGNLIVLTLFRKRHQTLNVKSAALHVVADTLSSVGVIAVGIIMYFTGLFLLDPLVSIAIALVIAFSSYRVAREAVDIILEATPSKIDVNQIERTIRNVDGVLDVHDTHVWCITPDICCLSAHVMVYAHHMVIAEAILNEIKRRLAEEFKVHHTTIQVETEGYEEFGEVHGRAS